MSPYFERLRQRARRTSADERARLWSRYIARVIQWKQPAYPWRQTCTFRNCAGTIGVYQYGECVAVGVTNSTSGWEKCAEQVRARAKAKALLNLSPSGGQTHHGNAGQCAGTPKPSPATGASKNRNTHGRAPLSTTARTGRVAPAEMAKPESRSGRPGAAVAFLRPASAGLRQGQRP